MKMKQTDVNDILKEPPFTPEVRSSANRGFICILGTAIGAFLSSRIGFVISI
tara:strand:+ start:69 stop:224 length:156 start_codon:yes stop_codon:yes gene_type:complete